MRRRYFIKRMIGAATVASAGSASAFSFGRIAGANDRVQIGLIGCGGRGTYDAKLMRAVGKVDFTAVCDVYEPHATAAGAWAGPQCRAYRDFRKLLEQKDVDAVLIATPDHWHAIPAVLACQAGKDVYVEKPLAHTVKEGRAMVDAARRYGRIVQAGTQHRSAPHYREVARIIQSGELGPIHFVRVWNYVNMDPDGIGRSPDTAPPPGLDWNFYLGPAPQVPFNKNRFLVTYRWFWDYAGGMATDFGTHRFDTVHQVMGVDAPLTAAAAGGRYVLKDGADTPDTLQITYEYPSFVLSYEASMVNSHGLGARTPGMTYYLARGQDDRPHGEAYYGARGTLFADRIGFEIYPEIKGESGPGALNSTSDASKGYRMDRKRVSAADATDLHVKNFIECVRSRQKPVADVEIGHRSTVVSHLGNIAYLTKGKVRWDAAREEIVADPQASALLGREARKPWDLI